MKTISKRIFVFLIVGLLSFCSVEMTYYKSVHAFEWVTAGISTVEALKWLLGSLGIIATATATGQNFWDGYEEEFYEYASDENIAGPDVRAWLEKLAKGTLDKGSEVWSCFKSWCAQLVNNNTSSGDSNENIGSFAITLPNTFYNTATLLKQYYPDDFIGLDPNKWQFPDFYRTSYIIYDYDANNGTLYFLLDASANVFINIDHELKVTNNKANMAYCTNVRSSQSDVINGYLGNTQRLFYADNNDIFSSNVVNDTSDTWLGRLNPLIIPIDSSLVVSNDFYTINDARQEQFDIINRNTANEVEEEVAIPMPGVSSGNDTISQDAYDNIIERVNNGDISVDDAVEEIQQVLQVIVFDTATDDVIPVTPDPDDPTQNEDKDDVINNSKSNMGFTLAGLENVFPFCIPWDIYAFLNLLDAEPVAPVFNIPFPNINDPTHPLTTEVDLSSWDDAMRIVRLAQDFLFIIGLAFLTRNLIGAGGGD